MGESLRDDARAIWQAGVDAVRPEPLVRRALTDGRLGIAASLASARRILVLGAGKAGAAMSVAVETTLADRFERIDGWVNVPEGSLLPTRRIHLHGARSAGSNHPTAAGVVGAEEILRRAQSAGPDDVALCLISGGGSALLPAPASGLTLADKQEVTRLLHACGATIHEMNAVRKHLSAIKGGRLAQAFRGQALWSLVISDVIGDPLDVIASGPTAPDPTTFADALAVLERFQLMDEAPPAVLRHLRAGAAGKIAETPKALPADIQNIIIGNNRTAYDAAWSKAEALGYSVISLGQPISGEAGDAARHAVEMLRCFHGQGRVCLLGGGETTVTLGPGHGKGGRNQEWVLAALCLLQPREMENVALLSGGTDGEDGPTDAAGACVDAGVLARAAQDNLDPVSFLSRHDAYSFFKAVDGLLITGLTNTNVMDIQVVVMG